jgi:hypothetical protein
MSLGNSKPATICAVLFALMSLVACGYDRRTVFRSPSGALAVDVCKSATPNSRIQIFLVKQRRRYLVNETGGEAFFNFVEVGWTNDEKTVGVLIRGSAPANLAFDIATGNQVPFDRMRISIESAIRSHYQVPPTTDPIEWSWSREAEEQFTRREMSNDLK